MLLLGSTVVIADDARNLPFAILVAPQVNELRFANFAVILRPRMKEAVDAYLDCAIVVDGIDLERSGNELAFDLSAEIVFDAVDDVLPSDHEAALVVIELGIL